MKTLFLEARLKIDIYLMPEQIAQLPKKIALFTTVQFIDSIENVLKQLKDAGISVHLLKARHAQYAGQILGCDFLDYNIKNMIENGIEGFLYIGDGMFHPQAVAMKNKQPVYCYNPFTKMLILFDRKDIDKLVKQHNAAITRFLDARNIGVIISIKPGQQFLRQCLLFKEKCTAKGKNVYLMLADSIDFNQLANFPFIECWVNSSCPRIAIDDKDKIEKPIVNLEDIFDMV